MPTEIEAISEAMYFLYEDSDDGHNQQILLISIRTVNLLDNSLFCFATFAKIPWPLPQVL